MRRRLFTAGRGETYLVYSVGNRIGNAGCKRAVLGHSSDVVRHFWSLVSDWIISHGQGEAADLRLEETRSVLSGGLTVARWVGRGWEGRSAIVQGAVRREHSLGGRDIGGVRGTVCFNITVDCRADPERILVLEASTCRERCRIRRAEGICLGKRSVFSGSSTASAAVWTRRRDNGGATMIEQRTICLGI